MVFLPRFLVIVSLAIFSCVVVATPIECEPMLAENGPVDRHLIQADDTLATRLMQQIEYHLSDPGRYIARMSIKAEEIDWSRVKHLGGDSFWSEYIIHYQGETLQLKVYFTEFMRSRRRLNHNIRADVSQMIVQSALAEIGMARPIYKFIPPLESDKIGENLRRYGLIREDRKDKIYFAAIFPYFDTYNTVVIPDDVEVPGWFVVNRDQIRLKINRLERALSKIGIAHGHGGQFFVSKDGSVMLADFDYLRSTGFNPSRAGFLTSIFIRPSVEVREIFKIPYR